jgi:hypothetical protein
MQVMALGLVQQCDAGSGGGGCPIVDMLAGE